MCLSGSALSDGQWHSVELNSRRGRWTVSVDEEDGENAQAGLPFSVAAETHLFFGGKRNYGHLYLYIKREEIAED